MVYSALTFFERFEMLAEQPLAFRDFVHNALKRRIPE